jgi:hypothetical protein
VDTSQQLQPPLIERIERALLLLAYFISLDGDVHLPMFEKFEVELEELRRRESAKDRDKCLLHQLQVGRYPRQVSHNLAPQNSQCEQTPQAQGRKQALTLTA